MIEPGEMLLSDKDVEIIRLKEQADELSRVAKQIVNVIDDIPVEDSKIRSDLIDYAETLSERVIEALHKVSILESKE